MRDLGVIQRDTGILGEMAHSFSLPAERNEAERITDELFAALDRISQVYPLTKGMGIVPSQIDIGRAAAVAQPPANAPAVVLLNPKITARS